MTALAALLMVVGMTHGHPEAPAVGMSVPTAAVAPDGTLWVAWVEGPHVHVGASRDLGKTFTGTVRVNADPEKVDANGEARPKIALGPDGELFVSYTHRRETGYTGDVRFSRSVDGGRTFSPPVSVLDEGMSSGRFDALTVAPNGDVHVFWIGRTTSKASALYQKVSTDRGRTFGASRKVKDDVCECCRLAVAWDGTSPLLLWRDLMDGGVRDHSLARIGAPAEPPAVRASDDGWEIAACPHQGPALAVGGDGTWHLAWFTGDGKRGKGTFYRRSIDGGRTFSEPIRIGSNAARPQVLTAGRRVWLAWKEAAGSDATAVVTMRSADAGATWSEPAEVARTKGASDHPLLVARGGAALLSWFSSDEGYRALPVE